MQQSGALLSVVACDASDGDEAVQLFGAASGSSGLVVLHASPLGDKGLLLDLPLWRFEWQFGPKATAARHVHSATAVARTEAVVFWSSVAAAFGNVGQGSYSAANACLDALGQMRRAHGAKASSMQLPLVMGAGMGAAAQDERQSRFRGMAAISLDEYSACLMAMLAPRMGAVVVSQTLLPTAQQRLLDSLPDPSQACFMDVARSVRAGRESGQAPEVALVSHNTLAQTITPLGPAERAMHLEALVLRVVKELVEGEVQSSTPLMEAGVDSLAATVELSSRLRSACELSLSPTLVFEH